MWVKFWAKSWWGDFKFWWGGDGVLTAKEWQWAWMQSKVLEREGERLMGYVLSFFLILIFYLSLSLYLFFFFIYLLLICLSGHVVCIFFLWELEREGYKEVRLDDDGSLDRRSWPESESFVPVWPLHCGPGHWHPGPQDFCWLLLFASSHVGSSFIEVGNIHKHWYNCS